MLSKWKPWDFVKSHPNLILREKPGLYAILITDPFVEKVLFERLPTDCFDGDRIKVISGQEITVDWLENTFQSLSLFGDNESFLVLHSEDIPSNVKKYILENNIILDQRFLLLSFGKTSPFFDKMSKSKEGVYLKIEAPAFWESGKLLSFICNEYNLTLSYDVQNYLLASLEPTSEAFVRALDLLKLHFPNGQEISLEYVKKLISPSRFDKFALASLFGKKKRGECIKTILELDPDIKTLEDFFRFMGTYLFSLADTSKIMKKSYHSKYDKEILAHSKVWKQEELQSEMRFFGELLIEAKKKSPILKEKMRLHYLSQF